MKLSMWIARMRQKGKRAKPKRVVARPHVDCLGTSPEKCKRGIGLWSGGTLEKASDCKDETM